MPAAKNLQAYRANVTSQFGEDGVIREILRRLGEGERHCLEFGAWDGRRHSNTWSLWHERAWSAVLIEGHPQRFATLRANLANFPRAQALQAYVTADGEGRLDALLARLGEPKPVDVMSIDIDGDDYHVFAAICENLPRIALVEFNPTCPPGAEIVQEKGGRFGCSAWSLLQLAQHKGYALAACTDTNLILVRAEDFGRLEIEPVKLEEVAPTAHLTYVLTDYDGQTYLNRTPVYAESSNVGPRRFFAGLRRPRATFAVGSVRPARVTGVKR